MVARPVKVERLSYQGPVYDELLLPFMQRRWDDLADEWLIEGPTGTGKSVGIGGLCKAAMRMFPGCNLLVMRRIKADLGGSFMQMWEEEILDWDDPWDRWMLTNGTGYQVPSHRSREVYKYPNGSRLWTRGMDQWARVKSMAYDLIWAMEATEFEEEQIEGLHTRRRARSKAGASVPFGRRMLLMDVNPEYPQHWANQRALAGVSRRVRTTLRDNPGYFDRSTGRYTEAGQSYLDGLETQIRDEARRLRYIQGIWAAATGQILEWDDQRNVFHGQVRRKAGQRWEIVMDRTHPVLGDRVELIGLAASYDWGKAHAGTLQVWGVDAKGRQYLVEEVYHSKKPLQWWAEWVVKFWKKYGLPWVVCDSAAQDSIDYFNERLQEAGGGAARIALPCDKRSGNRQQSNMEVLIDLFCEQRDGAPGAFVKADALAHAPDPDLRVQRFAEEIPQYLYAEYEPGRHKGRPEDRPDRKCVDDGLDACTYFRVQMIGGRKLVTKLDETASLSPRELMNRLYWEKARSA